MVLASISLKEDYWEDFELQDDDIEFLYSHLLDTETPLTPQELIVALVEDRIQRELKQVEEKRLSGGSVYLPQEQYALKQKVVFPTLDWRQAGVIGTRDGHNPDMGEFSVIQVRFDNGEEREFAAGLDDHLLNNPYELPDEDGPTSQSILNTYEDILVQRLEQGLVENDDFVYIAGRWFPRTLLVDVNTGHLNLAEAILDMSGGGPVPTSALLEQVELPSNENPKLVEFSLDLALQEDARFDEVGSAGKVLWYLLRSEPEGVRETPVQLRYREQEHDRSILTSEMLDLENRLDDELSPVGEPASGDEGVAIHLLYSHWRVGTLPLTHGVRPFFPTAYDAPRILFMLVDGESGEKFPGWVVSKGGYVFGLEEWYRKRELMPGSAVWVQRGSQPGEVIVKVEAQRSRRDWVRTVLVGADGGIVFATLKQVVSAAYDERMGIMVPDVNAMDDVWAKRQKQSPPFERVVVDVARELTKLNPQNHVHVTELYAAVNLVRRVPPGPIMALLASRPWFVHVGDLHFRFDDSAGS
ncbi:MAG: hypothetical protein ISS57_16860 [Anaerolineales bacterium]|nr:hypothetical protein [Anaerolineales bacterium]